MNPQLGQSTDDRGRTLYVLEARGHGIKLWGQNQPLDPPLNSSSPSACGDYGLDPGQYTIMFMPTSLFAPSDGTTQLASKLREELSVLGYEVMSQPIECSSFAMSTGRPA